MSATVALKAVSHRDSLAKTVRLLTRDGIDVQFRGHQPHVQTKGNKAFRLVLPELNDSASPELLEAIHGYLDHEVGHIFYTPFARATKAGTVDPKAPSLINIVEDIRLEKLLPRDLPGTKENLERMYDKFIPTMLDPVMKAAVESGNPTRAFSGTMVCAMRALAGQKAFQKHMDDNAYWPHFMPLLKRMPDLARRLKAMETFDDVVDIVTDVLAALTPPQPEPKPEPKDDKPAKKPPQKPQESDSDPKGDDDTGDGDDASDGAENGPDDEDSGRDESGNDARGESGDQDDEGDEANSGGGEGHGDGSGTDDEEGDEDDTACSGDGTDQGGDDGSDDDGSNDDDRDEAQKSSDDGKRSTNFTDAMKELDPAQRTALFRYKNRKQTVAEIASDMQKTEDEVLDLLRTGRRRLSEIMKGARS